MVKYRKNGVDSGLVVGGSLVFEKAISRGSNNTYKVRNGNGRICGTIAFYTVAEEIVFEPTQGYVFTFDSLVQVGEKVKLASMVRQEWLDAAE